MKIRIRSFVGCSKAELDVEGGIVLVGGDNAVGKSSVIRGVQTLLTGELTPKGVTKGNAKLLVMDGKKAGELALSTEAGDSISVVYPDPEYVTQGNPPTASHIAAGITRYTEMTDAVRALFLTELLKATPSAKKLRAALADDLEFSKEAVDQIAEMVENQGWDEAVTQLTERRSRLKGKWEGVANERYGDRKAVEWRPHGWDDHLDELTEEQVDAKVGACQEAYDRAIKATAVSETEHKALRDLVGKKEPTEMTLETARKQMAPIEAAWAQKRRELDALPPAVEDEGVPCPHCGAHVLVSRGTGTDAVKLLPVEPMLEGEIERRKRKIADKREEVREAMQRLESHQQMIGAAEEKLREIVMAESKLKGARVNGNGKSEELREQLENAKLDQKLWRNRKSAAELQDRIESHQAVIDLLGPKGMRRTALLDALAAFERDHLDPLTKDMATWKPLTIDRDTLLPLFGGRPYALLSKSEQYRTDITLQIAIALLQGASAVCLDGADILSHSGQDDLLMGLLDKLPFPVFVGATYSRPKACPNLDNAGIGRSYWINAGKLVPLKEALA